MIFQLVVFSLLLLLLVLLGQIFPLRGAARRRHGGGVPQGAQDERLRATLRVASRTYLLFAPYALLMYLQGKPDLLPQYLAWVVIALTVAQGAAHFAGRVGASRTLGALNAAILILLWVQELPLFQSNPA